MQIIHLDLCDARHRRSRVLQRPCNDLIGVKTSPRLRIEHCGSPDGFDVAPPCPPAQAGNEAFSQPQALIMELETQSHLPMLRRLLVFREGELKADVHAAQAERQAESAEPEVKDLKDGAEMLQRQVVDDVQHARDLVELQDVEDALARLDAGTYGDCARCGEAIPSARLMVQPAARHCTACQSALEKAT